MLILLPPSETKRPGGRGGAVRLENLALPGLLPERRAVTNALIGLSDDPDAAVRALGLGPRQRGEIAVNAALASAPTMTAVDRYTGVLYDALDAASLDPAARRWLGRQVLIHTAPFGPVRALDAIPAYRMGATASIPGLPALRRVWAEPVAAALTALDAPFVLDLRSEAYTALGAAPGDVSAYVRVVGETPSGRRRALNHFNKHAKGALVRTLALTRPRTTSVPGLLRWAEAVGVDLRAGTSGELELVV